MRFAIDVDGVVANYVQAFVHEVNLLWPGRLPIDYQFPEWHEIGDLTEGEIKRVLGVIHSKPNWWMGLRPYMENVSAIARHRKQFPSDELYFVTARQDTEGMPTMHQTQEWLRMCGIYGLGTGVIVDYGGDKVPIYNALQCDANIDDKLEAAIAHSRNTRNGILLDRVWNRTNRPPSVIAVSNLSEFFALARGGSKHATV